MISIGKNYSPFVKPAANHAALAVKNEVAVFIKGERTAEPSPFSSRVRQGKIRLCKIDDRSIFLNTRLFANNVQPVIRIIKEADGSIKALVYSASTWTRNRNARREVKGPGETFTVYDDAEQRTIYDAWPEESQPAPKPAPSPAPRGKNINHQRPGPAIARWAKDPSRPTPKPIEKTSMPETGYVHVCNLERQPVTLRLGQANKGKEVRLTFHSKGDKCFVRVLIIETGHEFDFCFFKNGQVNHKPAPIKVS